MWGGYVFDRRIRVCCGGYLLGFWLYGAVRHGDIPSHPVQRASACIGSDGCQLDFAHTGGYLLGWGRKP